MSASAHISKHPESVRIWDTPHTPLQFKVEHKKSGQEDKNPAGFVNFEVLKCSLNQRPLRRASQSARERRGLTGWFFWR